MRVTTMTRKRNAPSSQRSTHEQKPKTIREQVVHVEEESSDEEEESSPEEEEESSPEEEEGESGSESESDNEEEPIDDASKRETLRELLSPFSKSQIIDLLKQAVASDPQIVPKIAQLADSDPTHRKIFVHGLGWDASSDQLLESLAPFGEIEDSKLVVDRNTGRAKGYAFVLFKTRAAAKKALKAPQKQIGSRVVSCQLAALGPPSGTVISAEGGGGSRKLYVGNVGAHVSPEMLKSFFERFGEIEDGPLGTDPLTNKFRGFAIITFRSSEGFNKAMEEPVKVFDNCQLHCKKFVENPSKTNASVSSNLASADINYGGLGANLNVGGLLMAQNPAIGLAGQAMLAAAGYNPTGLLGGYNPSGLMTGYNPSGLMTGYNPSGLMTGYNPAVLAAMAGLAAPMTGNYGVMGNYGSQAAFHGLGAFQNVQEGQSPVRAAGTSMRGHTSGALPQNTFPSYFGH